MCVVKPIIFLIFWNGEFYSKTIFSEFWTGLNGDFWSDDNDNDDDDDDNEDDDDNNNGEDDHKTAKI